MSILKNIQTYFFNRELANARGNAPIQRTLKNLHKVKSVGIIYTLSSSTNVQAIDTFISKLKKQGIKVEELIFIEDVKISTERTLNSFNPKDLNWKKIPTKPLVTEFIEKDFDVLIDLTTQSYPPMLYICSLSKSKARIGIQSTEKEKALDVLIEIENTEIENIIERITYFLNNIHTE